MSSTVPALLDYLVALFRNAPTIGGATPPVEVIDGPMPASGPLPLALWVGVDDIAAARRNEDTTAADSEQERATMGTARDETVAVHCVAGAWTGDVSDGFTALRVAASGITAAVETVLRTASGAPATSQVPGVTGASWLQATGEGLQVYVSFQIIYRALGI